MVCVLFEEKNKFLNGINMTFMSKMHNYIWSGNFSGWAEGISFTCGYLDYTVWDLRLWGGEKLDRALFFMVLCIVVGGYQDLGGPATFSSFICMLKGQDVSNHLHDYTIS
jgi:hypothetical protein